ncbi:MAG: hypothetical protein KA354_17605 [Phycisphaerae bacterium]|nr:hypothetical protein [Phycisphaerae bacterium]
MATAGLTCYSNMPASDDSPCLYKVATLTGTIDEVENVVVNLLASNPNSTDSLATRDARTHIEFDLAAESGSRLLEGTAKVRQTRHLTTVSAVPVQGCGDTLYTDYDDREWTVKITAEITCRQDEPIFDVPGIGLPDGSEVPQPYRITDGCVNLLREQTVRDTWGSFSESGFQSDFGYDYLRDYRTDYPLPPNTTGEFFKEVKLKLSVYF